MARRVFFNPLGSFTDAYNAGLGAQQNLESNVRNARQADYSYYNENPIKLAGMQREENFANYADPGRRKVFDYGVNRAGNENFLSNLEPASFMSSVLGVGQPTTDAIQSRYGYALESGADGQNFSAPQPEGEFGPWNKPVSGTTPDVNELYRMHYLFPQMQQQATQQYKMQQDQIGNQNSELYRQLQIEQLRAKIANQNGDAGGTPDWMGGM